MSIYEVVDAAAKIDLTSPEGLTEADLDILPPGWKPMGQAYLKAVRTLHGKIVRMYYLKGTLQVQALGEAEDNEALKWLSAGMTNWSAGTCMMTGKHGQRRRWYRTWPCLALEFDGPFANEVHDKEGYDGFKVNEVQKGR